MMDPRDAVIYTPMDQAKASAYYTAVLYGEFGRRKTTTACSLVYNHGLLISSDNSWKILLKTQHKDIFDKITLVQYEGRNQLLYIDYSQYDTVIFDTFSKMVDNYLDNVMEHGKWNSKQFQRDKLQTKSDELATVEVPAFVDYRVVRDKFRPVLNNLFKLPINRIFTSHVNDPIPGLTNDIIRPRIPAATYAILAEEADIIARLEGGPKEFIVNCSNNSNVLSAKSRIEGLEGKVPIQEFISKLKSFTPDQRK